MRISAFILATTFSLCVVSGAFAKPGVSSNGSSAVIKRELCSRVEIEGECNEDQSYRCYCTAPSSPPPDHILCPDGGVPRFVGIVKNCSTPCWHPEIGDLSFCTVEYECCAPDPLGGSPLATE